MITSKEALEQIMEKYIFYVPARSEGKEHLLNCLNIIAKDLERLEKLEEDIITTYEFNKKLREENAKLKQIIDEIRRLPNCDICDATYIRGCRCLEKKIRKVLMKEVLGNE